MLAPEEATGKDKKETAAARFKAGMTILSHHPRYPFLVLIHRDRRHVALERQAQGQSEFGVLLSYADFVVCIITTIPIYPSSALCDLVRRCQDDPSGSLSCSISVFSHFTSSTRPQQERPQVQGERSTGAVRQTVKEEDLRSSSSVL